MLHLVEFTTLISVTPVTIYDCDTLSNSQRLIYESESGTLLKQKYLSLVCLNCDVR